jgi:hypothetical protein
MLLNEMGTESSVQNDVVKIKNRKTENVQNTTIVEKNRHKTSAG